MADSTTLTTNDAELDRQLDEAERRFAERLAREPHAESVAYDPASNRIRIELSNGCTFLFPPHIAQGLRGATAEELSDVEIYGGGFDLNWRSLDAQFDVSGLLAGRVGTKRWMEELRRNNFARDAQPSPAGVEAELSSRPREKKTA